MQLSRVRGRSMSRWAVSLMRGLCLAVVLVGGAWTTVVVHAQEETPPLIGFTSAIFDGAGGVLAMNRACALEFPGSRLCTTDEIVLTPETPLTSERNYAWVHSKVILSLDSRHQLVDSTGAVIDVSSGLATNCDGWSATGGAAVAVTTDTGAVTFLNCLEARPVACCLVIPDSLIFRNGFEAGDTPWSSSVGAAFASTVGVAD